MSRKQYIRRLILSLLASTSLPALAWGLEPSGTTVSVSADANASGPGGDRILNAPGDVFQGDTITTDSHGQTQIRFVDDTRFVIGPNSRITIDEFVFRPDGKATDVALNTLKGTFRFISGRSPHDVYAINTPTMTLGVRGTVLDIRVLTSGFSYAHWQEGGGFACVVPPQAANQERSDCANTERGETVAAAPGGGFASFRPGELQQLLLTLGNNLGPLAPGFGVPPTTEEDADKTENDRVDNVDQHSPY